ncbi:phytanoyl-CoA dioxygenase family protein [Actibacterium sp. 188UL27-1]|uniref:phytanoyl-CoA dioxygenase family protein n=1 Tax=Actibacterium sp. 188UL27-1 TaxID=2786961 RepID=UPI00195C536B|nr:phytanoyl-CoA dioxygenase family protein [Actibacterium sp. 188UL27-1]MBM7068998.1 phytanoyl-CoA dioxygenase family protein [Actibacterium sp. 188UL27-1]
MNEAVRDPDTDVSQPWDKDNQAWWDWYVSLADNEDEITTFEAVAPLPDLPLPSDEAVIAELAAPYELTDADVAFFHDNGFIKLKRVFSPGAVLKLRAELIRLLKAEFGADPDSGVQDRFLSLEMIWPDNPLLRAYVLSPRVAQICADLLEVPAVRLYHDNVLSKQPGCGRTPWHFDDHHFPLDTNDVVTAWAPAQPIPLAMGPLAFAYPRSIWELVDNVAFEKSSTSYDKNVAKLFASHQVAVDETPFEMGEVSFHHNLNFHTAARNRTDRSRIVLANTYYVDGARVVDSPTMVSGDWQKFMPGVGPGDIAASPLNPICWPVTTDE